ncbi:MAG: hypothetical protein K940chlam7_00758 [Chlamydiae bacterium]|nr:hypothetical protein [Chlamydiota bacterium]
MTEQKKQPWCNPDAHPRRNTLLSFPLRLVTTLLALCLLSCNSDMMSIHTDYMSHETLASYYVKTPDPFLNNPPIGQRLILSWTIPRKHTRYHPLYIKLTLRFRNREEEEKWIHVRKTSGTYIYYLLDKEYCEKGGLLTYKAQLIANNCVLEEWRHQLWAELILFEENPEENDDIEFD